MVIDYADRGEFKVGELGDALKEFCPVWCKVSSDAELEARYLASRKTIHALETIEKDKPDPQQTMKLPSGKVIGKARKVAGVRR